MLFVLISYDFPEHVPNNSNLYLCAYDTKSLGCMSDHNDEILLHEDICAMNEWTAN